MSTVLIPEPETFASALKEQLEKLLQKEFQKVKLDAYRKIGESIDELMARATIEIFNIVSFERFGNDLRITVDVKEFKQKVLNEKETS